MPNLYADVDAFRRRYESNATLQASDSVEIERVLEAASREIDDYSRRHFYAVTATRYFDGNDDDHLWLPDDLTGLPTSVKLDENTDGTYELTLTANTDYRVINGSGPDQDAPPLDLFRLNTIQGQRTSLSALPRLIEIVGRWGYGADTEFSLEQTGSGWTNAAIQVNLASGTAIASGNFAIGQTIRVDSEDMYIFGLVEAATDQLLLRRGVNGTTAASHNPAVNINRYVYTPQVRDACLLQAGFLWNRRQAPGALVIANVGLQQMEVYRGLAPEVKAMLVGVRRSNLELVA